MTYLLNVEPSSNISMIGNILFEVIGKLKSIILMILLFFKFFSLTDEIDEEQLLIQLLLKKYCVIYWV